MMNYVSCFNLKHVLQKKLQNFILYFGNKMFIIIFLKWFYDNIDNRLK